VIVLIPSTLTKVTISHSLIDALRSVLGSRGFEYGKDYNLIHVRPAFATLTNGLIAATIIPVPINHEAVEMGLNAAHQYSYRELLSISANGLNENFSWQLFVIGQPAPERF